MVGFGESSICQNLVKGCSVYKNVEPTFGFEPKTCCLRNSCSTTELRWPREAIVRNRPLERQRAVGVPPLRATRRVVERVVAVARA